MGLDVFASPIPKGMLDHFLSLSSQKEKTTVSD